MNPEQLKEFLDLFSPPFDVIGREIYYNYTNYQFINTKWIHVTSVDTDYIYFTFYGYAQERLKSKISHEHYNTMKEQNEEERLKNGSKIKTT